MAKTETNKKLKGVRVNFLTKKEKDIETEIKAILNENQEKKNLKKYVQTENVCCGPNMKKKRDDFRSQAMGMRLHKYF